MKKIDHGFTYLSDDISSLPPRYNPTNQSEFLGSFQPFVDIVNDFQSYLKPYKKFSNQLGRDLKQPLVGIGNFSIGVVYLFSALSSCLNEEQPWSRSLAWTIYGFSNIFRGITQVLFTPFTWLIKIPLRGMITLFNKSTQTNWEEKESVQSLVEKGLESSDEEQKKKICIELHRKFEHGCHENGKNTALADNEELKLYMPLAGTYNTSSESYYDPISNKHLKSSHSCSDATLDNYFNFFKTTTANQQEMAQHLVEKEESSLEVEVVSP